MTNEDRAPLRVLLVEDHASFRQALAAVFSLEADLELIGEVDNGDAAGTAAAEGRADVAVVDLDLPGVGGVEAIGAIRVASPMTRCLVLTALRDEVELGRAIEAGAAGLIHKSVDIDVLLQAIRDVAAGGSILAPDSTVRFMTALHASRSAGWHADLLREQLSAREAEILERLTNGGTNTSIASELGISPETVQTHVRNLMAKLGVGSRLQAVTLALRLGLVKLQDPPLPGSG